MTPRDPTAPVVVRFGAMGDMVLITVLLSALAQRLDRRLDVLTSGSWSPALLAHDEVVGELVTVTSRKRPYLLTPSQWRAVAWLRAHTGPVYLCDPDAHAAALLQRAGIAPGRILRAWDHRPEIPIHWADWWLQIAALDPPSLPAASPAPTPAYAQAALPRIRVPAQWLADAQDWMQAIGLAAPSRPCVLIQPGNKKTHRRGRLATAYYDKHWDPACWGEVIRGIWQTLPQAIVVICGSAPEAGLAQQVLEAAGPCPAAAEVVNLAPRGLTLPRLAVLACRAHSMVSVDTGPAHLAAAMDCPLVVLYGSAGWGQWVPRAPSSTVTPLGAQQHTAGARVDQLDAAAVLAAWRTLPARGLRLSRVAEQARQDT